MENEDLFELHMSLGAAKAKNGLGGGGFPVAQTRSIPIWEYLRASSEVTRRDHYFWEVRELTAWRTTVVSTSLIDDDDVTKRTHFDQTMVTEETVQKTPFAIRKMYKNVFGKITRSLPYNCQWISLAWEGRSLSIETHGNGKDIYRILQKLSDITLFEIFMKSIPFFTCLPIKIPWETQSALKKYHFAQFSGRTCLHKKCLSVRHPTPRRKKIAKL